MAQAGVDKRRSRGSIEKLPSGAYRVRVYGGFDPVTGRRHDLRETVPPGLRAAREAEKVRTGGQGEQDGYRHDRLYRRPHLADEVRDAD